MNRRRRFFSRFVRRKCIFLKEIDGFVIKYPKNFPAGLTEFLNKKAYECQKKSACGGPKSQQPNLYLYEFLCIKNANPRALQIHARGDAEHNINRGYPNANPHSLLYSKCSIAFCYAFEFGAVLVHCHLGLQIID